MRWRRTAGLRGDRGLTLVETSVTMLILGFVSSAVMVMISGTQKMTTENDVRLDQLNAGRVAVEAVSRNLRAAIMPSQLGMSCPVSTPDCAPAAFASASGDAIEFYSNVDNEANAVGASRVTYVLSGDELVERIQRPDPRPPGSTTFTYCTPAPPACPVRERVLARGIQPGAGLFTYYASSGSVMGPLPLTAEALADIDSVEIRIAVSRGNEAVQPATFLQRVSLPNANTVVRTDAG